DGLLIPLPTGKTLVRCQNHHERLLKVLRRHQVQHIAHVGWPVTHANEHGEMETLRFEEAFHALCLLAGQVIEGRKTTQLRVVCGDLGDARLGCGVFTHNALDKTRRLMAGTGYTLTTAPWRGTTKSDK